MAGACLLVSLKLSVSCFVLFFQFSLNAGPRSGKPTALVLRRPRRKKEKAPLEGARCRLALCIMAIRIPLSAARSRRARDAAHSSRCACIKVSAQVDGGPPARCTGKESVHLLQPEVLNRPETAPGPASQEAISKSFSLSAEACCPPSCWHSCRSWEAR